MDDDGIRIGKSVQMSIEVVENAIRVVIVQKTGRGVDESEHSLRKAFWIGVPGFDF